MRSYFDYFSVLAILNRQRVILDQKSRRQLHLPNLDGRLAHPWGNWILLSAGTDGHSVCVRQQAASGGNALARLLPLLWFGWQLLFSTHKLWMAILIRNELCQFAGCLACYFIGAFGFGKRRRAWHWLLVGAGGVLHFLLVRGINQRCLSSPKPANVLEADVTG